MAEIHFKDVDGVEWVMRTNAAGDVLTVLESK